MKRAAKLKEYLSTNTQDFPYMRQEFSLVIEKDSDGYFVATVPQLRGWHTQAKSLDKLIARIQEAIEVCLELE